MITTYQIRNVLRTYGNQLKKRSLEINDSVASTRKSTDFIEISVDARKTQMLNQISNDMISQVTYKNGERQAGDKFSEENPLTIKSGEGIDYEN